MSRATVAAVGEFGLIRKIARHQLKAVRARKDDSFW